MVRFRAGISRAAAVAAVLTGAVLIPDVDSTAAGPATERVNIRPDGDQSNQPGGGLFPSVSKDGSRVVFTSAATDMLDGDKDKGGRYQVYMRNRETRRNVLVSVSSAGEPANGNSFFPLISANGEAVVFMSDATNLVAHDDNGHQDVFLRNLETKKTYLVSDRAGKSRHSANNNSTQAVGISNKGLRVAFVSAATDLVNGVTDGNGVEDVFFWSYHVDRDGLHTETDLVSHGSNTPLQTGDGVSGGVLGGGDRGNGALSGNGDCVAFGSRATNLADGLVDKNQAEVDVYMSCGYLTGKLEDNRLMSKAEDGTQGNGASYAPSLDLYGHTIAYFSTSSNLLTFDTNGRPDIFVAKLDGNHDVTSLDRANLTNSGSQDGTGAAPIGSQALNNSGDRIAFASFGRMAPPTDCVGEQVYLRDMDAETTKLVSVMTNGNHCGDRFSNYANISRNGTWVVWTSAASKLAPYDTNNDQDEFIRGAF